MEDLKQRFGEFRELLQTMVDFKAGRASAEEMAAVTYRDRDPRSKTLKLPRYSQRSTVSASSSEPPPTVTGVEAVLYTLFPIPVYTRAIDWLLKKEPVKKYIYYQVLKKLYTDPLPSKPDWETVMTEYLDFMLTFRVQSHLGKAGGNAAKLHFSRFPLPDIVLQIAVDNISSMHRERVPGDKDYASFFRDKCNGIKRNHLYASPWVVASSSKQEMAQKLLWEKYDFYIRHRVTCYRTFVY